MEKYFIVTEKCQLREDYLNYKQYQSLMRHYVNAFMDKHNIESKQYCESADTLYIVPTEKDVETFGKMMAKDIGMGLRPFKKNSRIAKSWANSLKEKKLKVLHRPHAGFYFKEIYGKFSHRLFVINDVMYCSMAMDRDFETPEGLEEMKASEFFKVIEDYEESQKGDSNME